MIIITILLSAVYGFGIGANDAANSFAAWIGSRTGKVRTGMILCGSFALIGALLEGYKVSKTIGKGIIPPEYITIEAAVIGLIAAILWVITASFFGFPVSTTHSVVGAVAGIGIAVMAPLNLGVLKNIILCWMITPTGSLVIAFLIFSLLNFVLDVMNFKKQFMYISKILLTLTSIYVAYTWGANDVANATALVSASDVLSPRMACLVGGTGMLIGAVILGYRVAVNVGFNITRLNPISGISANLATAITIHTFTQLHMPVSTTHALVGAIFGVGIARGTNLVNFRVIRDIVLTWIITPIATGLFAMVVFCIVKLF